MSFQLLQQVRNACPGVENPSEAFEIAASAIAQSIRYNVPPQSVLGDFCPPRTRDLLVYGPHRGKVRNNVAIRSWLMPAPTS